MFIVMKIFTILFIVVILIRINDYYFFNGIKKLIIMYKRATNYVCVYINAGLGNRLMSLASIIVLSIIYNSKPMSIYYNHI